MKTVLYLHGFRSSPQSAKATLMAQAIAECGVPAAWHCPQLPASPAQALALANTTIESARSTGMDPQSDLILIGSSLGGYYATCLAEQWQCSAAVLNPVVNAARDLATQVGEHRQYHSDEPFVFLPDYVDELAAMAVPALSDPRRYYLLATTGDEVLDWREMSRWYAGAQGRIVQGSDHGISDFAKWLPDVLAFALGRAKTDTQLA